MIAIKPYRRMHAVEYARTWALSRNPLFSRFDTFGGDCTNFVSQCLFAGSCIMNETPTFGWFYRAQGDYAPAWTGVPYLYNFLIDNMEVGPFGHEIPVESAEPGDIIQLGRRDDTYYHTLLVTGMREDVPLVCAHDNDALDRPLDTYTYDRARCVHIDGVRFSVAASDCCFEGVISGTSIFPNPAATAALSCIVPTESHSDDDSGESTPTPPTEDESDLPPISEPSRPADRLPENFVVPNAVGDAMSDFPSD